MPASHRISDVTTGTALDPILEAVDGSPNVFVNLLNAMRINDPYSCLMYDEQAIEGSPTVFANSLGMVRVDDAVSDGSSAMTGSENVFINCKG